MDLDGRFVVTIGHHESAESALVKLRRLAGL